MMRQEHLRGFLLGALLISVASAQGCSVCGDGYQVGMPSAIASVSTPEKTDYPFTCSDLEFAGLDGLIPSDECSVLSSLIFETCDCQEIIKRPQSTNEYPDSPHGSGYSYLRRAKTWFASPALITSPPVVAPVAVYLPSVVAPIFPVSSPPVVAPYYGPIGFAPISAPVRSPTISFDPTSYTYRPTYYSPRYNPPTEAPDNHLLIIVVGILVSLGFFALVSCGVAMSQSTPTSAMQMPAQGSGYQIQATPTTLPMIPVSTPMQLKKQALERRPQVLAALFPDEGKPEGDDGEGPISRRSLRYDSTSKQYVFCEDPTEATSCSICMDTLVPEDDTVTGLCTHIYHRECIMNWLQGGHDECPNCRQPMWDPETYKMVDQQIMDQNSGRPSAPPDDCY